MDTKLKNFSGKIIKEKSLIFNLILILSIFMVSQVIGVVICFKFFSHNLLLTLVSLFVINFIMYKVMRKLLIL
ncbi:Hypothetical protein RLITU_0737 [Romboutsia lituseburensis]|uniref:Uncharacterized protein n=1 Tax=Romboutsia lituseburensis DSM 797 TaxID=1121325 RepID=A0A1G9PFD4_9FIRM|nr:Hypothetical protein RLITU_0737 [Romboutsia lituseburensis]SDL96855.1 hypothetical protein SAMN04515677_104317 [Romboutsia lituseburensis DSM 797]